MAPRARIATLVAATAIAALAGPAASSQAAISCAYIAATHEVTIGMNAAGDSAKVSRAGNVIQVDNGSCPGGPTVTNTAKIIWIDTSPGGTTSTVDLTGGPLGPRARPRRG